MAQKLHTFKAESLEKAHEEMRQALGRDAIVVNTREVREGGILGFFQQRSVELTASVAVPMPVRNRTALEKKYSQASQVSAEQQGDKIAYFEQLVRDAKARIQSNGAVQSRAMGGAPGSSSILPFERPASSTDNARKVRSELTEIRDMVQVLMAEAPGAGLPLEIAPYYTALVEQGFDRELALRLLNQIRDTTAADLMADQRIVSERLNMEIRKRLNVTGGIRLVGDEQRIIALVGPTGVGKTTSLAKLAARYVVREHARVALITADTYRVGAPEQLRVYANILGVPMLVVDEPEDMAAALRKFKGYDAVFVDTAGCSPYNAQQLNELQAYLRTLKPHESTLVLSANTHPDDMVQVAERFRPANPSSLLFTKLDETQRYGALLALSERTHLPLSYCTTGQNVPDDLVVANAGAIATLIMEGIKHRGRSSK